ncbi:MAG: hypothetical protein M1820_009918 [Bogoriella megaspora]|nr:MAG: hypothetical protein M1820_009918 [Bogoriella megaspora]
MLKRFTTSRRLAIIALFTFLASLVLLRRTSYSGRWSSEDAVGNRLPLSEDNPDNQLPADDVEIIEPYPPSPGHSPEDEARREKEKSKKPKSTPTPSLIPIPSKEDPPPPRKFPNPLSKMSRADVDRYVEEMIQWDRPQTGHWPSYGDYVGADYDPNRWEGFESENSYYLKNGVKRLHQEQNLLPRPYLPYPDYNSREWRMKWKGEYQPCMGPRERYLNESLDDQVFAYRGLPEGFPNSQVNSADITGINENICFDRFNRYGAFGFGHEREDDIYDWRKPMEQPRWDRVKWGKLQNECLVRNQDRYEPMSRSPSVQWSPWELPEGHTQMPLMPEPPSASVAQYKKRTAILIRVWEGYDYTDNDIRAIRAMITELALFSGGEYQVFLFVNIKDYNADIYENQDVHDDFLRRAVPSELQDIAILWTEKVTHEWYPYVGDWQVYWMQWMSVQWFSKHHPEFEFIWNWETDARYTGHHYHFFERIAEFARSVPRKHLWERNKRLYFPEAHGTYKQFLADTDATIEAASKSGTIPSPVWGPLPYAQTQSPLGPRPPRPQEKDNFQWGVDEEADLITLQPIWDPAGTDWSYRHKIFNFVPGIRPHFSPENPADEEHFHEEYPHIPRRVFINTVARFSRRMLHAMHAENRAGRSMQAEMWPATVALHHGLKAVYAPHPIWVDKKWPARYMDVVFNADGGKDGRWTEEPDSIYNHDREVNFKTFSWYYATGFPKTLYRRWLGWEAVETQSVDGGLGRVGGEEWEKEHGRMCLPGMLLHPVKHVVPEDV